MGSLGRLKNLQRNLQRNEKLFESYNQVIQEQFAEGVVEKITNFHHKVVIHKMLKVQSCQLYIMHQYRKQQKPVTE